MIPTPKIMVLRDFRNHAHVLFHWNQPDSEIFPQTKTFEKQDIWLVIDPYAEYRENIENKFPKYRKDVENT